MWMRGRQECCQDIDDKLQQRRQAEEHTQACWPYVNTSMAHDLTSLCPAAHRVVGGVPTGQAGLAGVGGWGDCCKCHRHRRQVSVRFQCQRLRCGRGQDMAAPASNAVQQAGSSARARFAPAHSPPPAPASASAPALCQHCQRFSAPAVSAGVLVMPLEVTGEPESAALTAAQDLGAMYSESASLRHAMSTRCWRNFRSLFDM